MIDNSQNNMRLARNTLLLYFRMFLIMGVTLYTSRVVLQVLGVEDYGIYNIVGGVVAIFTSISSSIGGASSRFLTFSLGTETLEEQRNVFNTAMIIHAIFCIIVLLFSETLGLYLFYEKLVIPAERMEAAFWAFQYSVVSVLLIFVSLPYNSIIIAHEKMDVYAYISIFDVTLRLVIVYLLQFSTYDRLAYYAFLLLAVQILVQLCCFVYCRCSYQETRLKWIWNKKLQKRMMSYTTWIFVGSITSSVYVQGLNILLNIFLGPIVNAAQGIAMQVQTAILRFSQNFQTAIRPQITKSYAECDFYRFNSLVNIGTKCSFVLMFAVALPLMLQVNTILKMWLGEYPEYSGIFVNFLVVICLIRIFASPLMMAVQATGNIRKVQLWECFILIVLPISYFILKTCNVPLYIVFVVDIFFEIISLVIRISIVLPLIRMKSKYYVNNVVCPVLQSTLAAIVLPVIISFIFNSGTYMEFILITIISVVSVLVSFYFLGLNFGERVIVKSIYGNFTNKTKK